MTKISTKTKKRSKQTYIIIAMAIAMVVLLAFGGTYAYFTATTRDATGTFTTGYVKLSSAGVSYVETTTKIFPGSVILNGGSKFVVDTNDTKGNYVAMSLTITAKAADGTEIALSDLKIADFAPDTTWAAVTGKTGVFIYGTEAAPTAVANAGEAIFSASGLTLPISVADNWKEDDTTAGNFATASENKLMDATITVTIKGASIQASNIDASNASEVSAAVAALVAKLDTPVAGD